MGNPYMEPKEKPPKVRKFKARKPKSKNFLSESHRRAPQQEAEVAHRLGGRTTAASGAKDEKGDVRVKGIVRVECKTTKNKSFSVTLDMFTKIEDAASSAGEVPVLLVEFNNGSGKKLGELAVIPSYLLDEFVRNQQYAENHQTRASTGEEGTHESGRVIPIGQARKQPASSPSRASRTSRQS